jgi:N-acetylmuramoyl-L-alanine amidase
MAIGERDIRDGSRGPATFARNAGQNPVAAACLRFSNYGLPAFRVLAVVWLCSAAPVSAHATDWSLRTFFTLPGEKKPATASSNPAGDVLKPVAFRLRAVKRGSISRLEITLTRRVEVDAFLLADPNRVIIDMPDVLFQLVEDKPGAKREGGESAGLIKMFRYGALGKGKSRVIVDLASPAKIANVSTIKLASTVFRLRIDLADSSSGDFAAAAKKSLQAVRARLPASSQPKSSVAGAENGPPVVVIDPGHGGIDGGAKGFAEDDEKDIVLAFSKTLFDKLKKTGRYKVVMTRSTDIFIPLQERVAIARKAKAKLFISVHADSLGEKWVRGATVYTVSERASDALTARVQEKENRADERAGFQTPQVKEQISDILFDLTRRETRAFSHVFANHLVSRWKTFGPLNKNPRRSGNFIVLKAADVPSVLLELGYLSSKQDSALLSQDAWRNKAADGVVASIDRFFASQRGVVSESKAEAGAKVAENRESSTPGNATNGK